MNIRMPYDWWPRSYQLPVLQALDGGCKRALLLWHRKSGKDTTALNWAANYMVQRPTSLLYMLPEFGQAKRIVMRELNDKGQTYLDQAFPKEIRAGEPNTQEGFLKLFNGSVLQLGGFDSIDRYIGAGPKVVIMSEYAVSQHAERAWQLLQPILLRNGGTAVFPYTPRGKNHGLRLYETARKSPDWYCSRLTVDDTDLRTEDGDRLVDLVHKNIESGEVDEAHARQEFWCSFEAPNSGSYYGRMLEQAEQQGRICPVPWDPSLPVYTWWDIGVDDASVVWFVQAHRGGELRFIDYLEDEGQPLSYYLDALNSRRADGWRFEPNGQLVPHDFATRSFQTGESSEQAARKMGWRMTVVPATSVQEGIDAVRRVLPRCWFDSERCKVGLDRLRNYTKAWSAQLQRFTGPLHDANSHASDAFRTGVQGMRMAGMHIAKNVAIAQHEGAMAHQPLRPFVATTDFSAWSS
jgi:phage terminase large subunit